MYYDPNSLDELLLIKNQLGNVMFISHSGNYMILVYTGYMKIDQCVPNTMAVETYEQNKITVNNVYCAI